MPPKQKAQTRSGALEYCVSGEGGPTLVLLNGAGVQLEGWRPLYPAIESLGTVFAYNRFGIGGSDPPRTRQTGAVIVSALHELLGYAGLAPPYILVGHSLGGLYANLFARLHPAEVAGCVLLDATHPADQAMLREHEAQLLRALGRQFPLPQQLFRRNVHSELKWLGETVAQAEGAGRFPAVPLVVVTGGKPPPRWLMPPEALRRRRSHQQALARLSPRGEQWVARGSGHFPQLSEPQLVLEALGRVAARALRPAPAPAC
ncbi:MAG: alpha/beta fold hydrolase [Burkholderiales bacterium]|nr:alpha/beta fold hydrolase [Burkholderiales bacterium]